MIFWLETNPGQSCFVERWTNYSTNLQWLQKIFRLLHFWHTLCCTFIWINIFANQSTLNNLWQVQIDLEKSLWQQLQLQVFLAKSHKLCTPVYGQFIPLFLKSPLKLCRVGSVWTAIFRSLHRRSMGFKSGLWLGHSRTVTDMSWSHSSIVFCCMSSAWCWHGTRSSAFSDKKIFFSSFSQSLLNAVWQTKRAVRSPSSRCTVKTWLMECLLR